jgi:hypothetical protein
MCLVGDANRSSRQGIVAFCQLGLENVPQITVRGTHVDAATPHPPRMTVVQHSSVAFGIVNSVP